MASMPDPLSDDFWKHDSFNWADEVDGMVEATIESHSATSIDSVSDCTDAITECSTSPEPNGIDIDDHGVVSIPKFEYICDTIEEIDEDLIPMPLVVNSSASTVDPSTSFAQTQTVETEDDHVDEELERLFSSVSYEFHWRNNIVYEEPDVHHFNWFGQGMLRRSSTLPEESLAVMLTDPKAPQATGDLRVESILRNAYGYLDPVIVCFDDEVDSSFWNLRGSALQRAAKGRCFKHYTPHGRWHSDPEERIEQNVLDAGGINNYLNPNVVIGNGFVSNALVPSRSVYHNRLQEKIQNAPCLSSSPIFRERKPSPLRQIDCAPPLEIEAAPTTPVAQQPPVLGPSTVIEAVIEAEEEPEPEPELDTCEAGPSTVIEAEEEPEPYICEAGPSLSRATPARLVLQTPVAITLSKAKPSAPLDPSRDPDVYYSFPTSPFRYKDSKCKRVCKKVKRYIKNKIYQIRASL